MTRYVKRIIPCLIMAIALAGIMLASGFGVSNAAERKIDRIIREMSMDEKISQMIIPAIRTWDEENGAQGGAFKTSVWWDHTFWGQYHRSRAGYKAS